jgi:putative transposase
MLSLSQFDEWSRRLQLNAVARAFLAQIRSSDPVRRVSNAAGNMCGSFASEKMGHTVQWESLTGERPLVLLWEYDPSCLEMWDQSWKLKISYVLPSGKKSGGRTAIDFVVLKKDWVGGVDYKTAAELSKLSVEQPYRWVQTGPKTWDQPPAREALNKLGLGYRVLSDHDIPHVLVRNVEFLRPRLMREVDMQTDAISALRSALASDRRVLLTDAIGIVGDPSLVYEGHFRRHWHLDLQHEALALPDNAWVYRDLSSQRMFEALGRATLQPLLEQIDPDGIPLGSTVVWAGQHYRLVNRTPVEVFLLAPGQPLVPMLQKDFRPRVRSREILAGSSAPITTNDGLEVLKCVTDSSVDEAIEKLEVLERVRAGVKVSECGTPRRTYYDWRLEFEEGEKQYGNGFIGLISRHDLKGNRTPRTDEAEVALLKEAFAWLREPVPREAGAGYAYYVALCAKAFVEPRSLASFNGAWNAEDSHAKTEDREGKRAAYPVKPPRTTGGAHLQQGPPEGDTPFGRVHIDHLQSDTFCRRMNTTQLLGKPWFSIAIDAMTRWVLGLWVSILAPSHASVMMVMRDIVRRHGKLPLFVITDGGADFKAKRVAKFLASCHSEHGLRPASEPRFGNPVERLNLDINHHLTKVVYGSNEVLKTPRMTSRSHDPRELSYLTVPMLAAHAEDLLFNKYPDKPHDGLQCTVNEALRSAAALQGTAWGVPTAFDEQFIFRTLAQPHKHGGLMRQRDGIRLNSYNYYADELVGRDNERLREAPLYDPEDPLYLQARLGGRWTRCEMIDSQQRRLPPPDHRRFLLAEHIYLARPSTSKDKQLAFLASVGNMYMEQDAERERLAAGLDASNQHQANGVPTPLSDQGRNESAKQEQGDPPPPQRLGLVAAPVSRRGGNT